MSDIQVQYQGFHPSAFTEDYLDLKLSDLHDRAPYGSTLRAVFVREGAQLKAQLRITSAAGEFFAVARGPRLREVSRKLISQVGKQLDKWKTSRHGDKHGSHVA